MLIQEINKTHAEQGSLALWWLGQSGFAIKGGNRVIYLDPYLSTRLERITADKPEKRHIRLCGIPVLAGDISNADYVFCSHDHGDHLDPDTLLPLSLSSPKAKFISPRDAQKKLASLGISPERIIPADAGKTVDLGDIQVNAVPGKHNEFDWSQEDGYPYQCFIISFNGVTILHAGDTIMYEGLIQYFSHYDIDLALLPINGGDPDRINRGFMSNMNYQEAADLGVEIGAGLIIPTHYNMFQVNNEKVENFVEYISKVHPKQNYQVLEQGVRFLFSKKDYIITKCLSSQKHV